MTEIGNDPQIIEAITIDGFGNLWVHKAGGAAECQGHLDPAALEFADLPSATVEVLAERGALPPLRMEGWEQRPGDDLVTLFRQHLSRWLSEGAWA